MATRETLFTLLATTTGSADLVLEAKDGATQRLPVQVSDSVSVEIENLSSGEILDALTVSRDYVFLGSVVRDAEGVRLTTHVVWTVGNTDVVEFGIPSLDEQAEGPFVAVRAAGDGTSTLEFEREQVSLLACRLLQPCRSTPPPLFGRSHLSCPRKFGPMEKGQAASLRCIDACGRSASCCPPKRVHSSMKAERFVPTSSRWGHHPSESLAPGSLFGTNCGAVRLIRWAGVEELPSALRCHVEQNAP